MYDFKIEKSFYIPQTKSVVFCLEGEIYIITL